MARSFGFCIVLGIGAAGMVGCASPGKAITQTVRVETPGCPGARCTLSNDRGNWGVPETPGDAEVTTSREPLKVVCKSKDNIEGSAGASSSLSSTTGVGALAGGVAGGAAVGMALGSVALAFIPVIGVAIVAIGVGAGAAGGMAVEGSQQSIAYPPVISVPMSCGAPREALEPHAGRFGVGFHGLSVDEAQSHGLGARGAVLVTDVAAGSIAEVGGLRAGDIVLAANGREIVDAGQLELAVLSLKPGEAMALRVWRNGQSIEANMQLPKRAP